MGGGVRTPGVLRQAAAVTALLAALAGGVMPASAQVRVGSHGLYHNKFLGGNFGYGARAEIDLGVLFDGLMIAGTYDRVSPDCAGCRYWEAGGQVALWAGLGTFGLGAYFSRSNELGDGGSLVVEDDWVFAMTVSARYPVTGFATPFLELQNELGEGILNRQTISLGLLLGPHGRGAAARNSIRGKR